MRIDPCRAAAPALLLTAWAAVALLSGCGGLGGKPNPREPLAGSREQQAADLLAQVRDADALGRWGQVVRTTGAMLDYHRDDPRCGTALALAIPAALKAGDRKSCLGMAQLYQDAFPADTLLVPAFEKTRDLALTGRDTLTASAFQVLLWRQDPHLVLADPAHVAPLPVLDNLDLSGLDRLGTRFAALPVEPILRFHRVRRLLLSGREDQARSEATALTTRFPDDPWARAAADLAAGRLALAVGGGGRAAAVVGLLVPLSGRYAGFGNAMDEGARLAVAHAREAGGPDLTLEEMDTGGDPVQAAQAAEAFCTRPDVGVLVGGLASGTTVAAALIASSAGVPLISPTASNERIASLGEGIYQTNMNDQRDIGSLVELAVTVLDKKRIAILGPDNPAGHGMADIFRARVDSLGGEVVAEAYFPAAVTDFHTQILAVRRREPEVVFVPASFEQMALLGPQVDFHHLGSLVLGPSAWSSDQPDIQQAAAFEGTVFPDAQARFPADWVNRFADAWEGDAYSKDQTTVARMTYLAVRKLTAALDPEIPPTREGIARALAGQFHAPTGEVAAAGDLAALGRSLRLVREDSREPFPVGLFAETMAALADSAAADSLSAPADSTASGISAPR